MFLNDYQDKAISTAIYPAAISIYYPALGLAGEYGELIEKIHLGNHNLILKEIGDLLWYIANLADDLGATLTEIMASINCTAKEFEQLQYWAVDNRDSFQFQIGNTQDFIGVKIGSVCELIKKLYRDDDGLLTFERRISLLTNLAWVLVGICVLVTSLDLQQVETIAKANLQKLASRKQRNKIHGDGDTR